MREGRLGWPVLRTVMILSRSPGLDPTVPSSGTLASRALNKDQEKFKKDQVKT